MSNQSIISSKSNNTLSKNKDEHTIPLRIEFIKKLLNNNELQPMVNFDVTNTENFTKRMNNDDDSDSHKSHDTRNSLNKKLHNFVNVINTIGGQLEYIKSGTTGHTFKGKVANPEGEEINYGVKVVAYPKKEKYGNIYDERRPENAELMMIKLLSYFVIKKQTPHIVLPIGAFNTEIKNFVNLIEENVVDKNEDQKYVEFIQKQQAGEYFDNVSILISEWANRGDMLDFLRKNYKQFKLIHWKVFFFQIISTLAVIHSKFPAFRHNDMKANNILIQKIDKKKKKFMYIVSRNHYSVPNIGYFIKLWDFDFSCIPGIVDNAKVSSEWTKSINVVPEQNRYYDMHYFFNTMIKKGFFPQILTEKCVPQEVRDFVDRIVPPKYREGKFVHKRGRILINVEYLIPEEVLRTDIFFEEFRKLKDNYTRESTDNIKINQDIGNKSTNKQHGSSRKESSRKGSSRKGSSIKRSKKTSKNQTTKHKYNSRSEEIDDIKLEDLLKD
jgi:hypothetical protein